MYGVLWYVEFACIALIRDSLSKLDVVTYFIMQLVRKKQHSWYEKNWSFVLLQNIFSGQHAFHKLVELLVWTLHPFPTTFHSDTKWY